MILQFMRSQQDSVDQTFNEPDAYEHHGSAWEEHRLVKCLFSAPLPRRKEASGVVVLIRLSIQQFVAVGGMNDSLLS